MVFWGNNLFLVTAAGVSLAFLFQPNAAKKYDQPPRYLPSKFIRQKSASKEAAKEKSKKEQAKKPSALTMQALEKHDRMTDSGPCSLRQFACDVCHLSWWRVVLKRKPVSRCKGDDCGKTRYDALPKDREFGIGRCLCPNEACKREFFVFCEASETFACRKCKTQGCRPYIHPKWRKKAAKKYSSQLNPRARDFVPQTYSRSAGPHFEPPADLAMASYYEVNDEEGSLSQSFSSLSTQEEEEEVRRRTRRRRRRAKRQIFNASQPHTPTNSTISTFLSQVDFERICEEVELDYGSDEEDNERVGACKFECVCGKEYTAIVRMMDQAKCYHCHRLNNPLRWAPPRDIERLSDAKHSCSRCNGRGNCPNLA